MYELKCCEHNNKNGENNPNELNDENEGSLSKAPKHHTQNIKWFQQ